VQFLGFIYIFLGLTVVQIAVALVKALRWTIPSGIGRPRDYTAGYPIGFGLVPFVLFVVAWRDSY